LKTQETRADIIFFNIQFGPESPLVDWIASDAFPPKIIMEVSMEKARCRRRHDLAGGFCFRGYGVRWYSWWLDGPTVSGYFRSRNV